MGFFDRLLNKSAKKIVVEKNTHSKALDNPECRKLIKLGSFMHKLLRSDHFIAKSKYLATIKENKDIISYFSILRTSKTLTDFCRKNNLKTHYVEEVINTYNDFESLVDSKNEQYIKKALQIEKNYLDTILSDIDPKIILDEDQRRVVLSDEDYTLVIAGAGAGKTTTVAAKVKYLVDKLSIDPKQILVVSYTNDAVNELRDRINTHLGIPCPIATFHSTGNAILRKQNPEPLKIVEASKLYFVLQDYFKSSILKNEAMVNNLIMFFSSYFDAPYEGEDLNEFFNKVAKGNYSTLKSDLDDYQQEIIDTRTKKTITIQNEMLRSYEEVEIANFLYLNGIDYIYEPLYEYRILGAKKPYTPDFRIEQDGRVAYIEHFGITQSGKNNRYSDDELQLYKRTINHKIQLHKQHGTTLIYTFSSYNDNRSHLKHLEEELIREGFEIRPRSNQEIMTKLVSSEENRYIKKLVSLITRFIQNFKVNGFEADEFDRMYHKTQNVRSRLFLTICNDCYLEYQRYLKENGCVDFEDMINNSAKVLRDVKELKQKLDFKYIIVDEYQDISRQRFDLVTALHEVTDAKIIAVGDDWQSIYAFSGSDISLFTNFSKKMGYAKEMKIRQTYRNSQEVIDIAGKFIQENEAQIKKDLISPKNITDPVIIYTYDSTRKKPNGTTKSGANYALAMAVETALGQIVEYGKKEKNGSKDSTVLLIGRYGFDGDALEKTGLFEFKNREGKIRSNRYPWMNITFMTAHASKGLGYDNVIIVNGKNETYGFPCKIEDDPVLAFVIKGDRSIDYAEERRLFYVAMTRTKNRIYCIAPEKNPSEFLLELKSKHKNVVLRGDWDPNSGQRGVARNSCPICGYPMQFRYKPAYGLRLYICTNEPELCGFMTNDLKGQKMAIMKCNSCRDGYLIVKHSSKTGNPFLGCTGYTADGTGCNNTLSKDEYYKMMKYPLDKEEPEKPIKTQSIPERTVKTEIKHTDLLTATKAKPDNEQEDTLMPMNTHTKVVFKDYCLNDVVYQVLSCLKNISKINYFGEGILIGVLRGSEAVKIKKNKLTEIPEYRSLANISHDDLHIIIKWMIDKHLIIKTNHPQYPVLHITPEGLDYRNNISSHMLTYLKKLLAAQSTTGDEETLITNVPF